MFPVSIRVSAGQVHPGRDALFERVDRFAFVDRREGRVLTRVLPLGAAAIALVQSTGHDVALHETNRATMLVPLRGRIGVQTRGARFEAGEGGAIVLGAGRRETFVRPDDRGVFEAAVAVVPGTGGDGGQTVGRAFREAAAGPAGSLQSYLRWFVAECARPGTLVTRATALRAAEALILDLFGALDETEPMRAPAAFERHVRRAEEILRARFDEPLTVEDLAREVGVGVRALQAAFRARRGRSPREALTELRLLAARELLSAPDSATSVSDAALASGFAHFGRFSAVYRARFGEAPSETLRRARLRAA